MELFMQLALVALILGGLATVGSIAFFFIYGLYATIRDDGRQINQ